MRAIPKYLALLVLGTMLITTTSFAQLPSKMPVQDFLDQLMQRTEKVVATKNLQKNNTATTVIRIGSYLFMSISNAKLALQKEGNKEIDLVTAETKEVLTKLNAIVLSLEYGDSNPSLIEQARAVKDQLTFDKNVPQVNDITPIHFMANRELLVKLQGFFPANEAANNFLPFTIIEQESTHKSANNVLTKKTQKVTIIARTNASKTATFSIPSKYLPSVPITGLSYTILNFYIPYIQKTKDTESRAEAKFTFLFAVFPERAGQLTLTSTSVQQVVEKKQKKTKTFIQHATRRDIMERYCIPTTGGAVIPGTEKLIVEWSQGEQDLDWSYYKRKGGCYIVETIYSPAGLSGRLNFHINYMVKETSKSVKRNDKSSDFQWGDRQTFTVNPKDWKLIFEAYDGTKLTLDEVKENPFLEVSVVGNQMEIKTPTIQDFLNNN